MKGQLITLEGIDGCGKTTVATWLAQRLTNSRQYDECFPESLLKRSFVFTTEPTNGDAGRLLRTKMQRCEDASSKVSEETSPEMEQLEELFLFMADHADHLAKTVKPALKKGYVVISDRYSDSRVAYQGATLRDVIPKSMDWIHDLHSPWSTTPDLTLFYSIDPTSAMGRCRFRWKNATSGSTNGPEKFERVEFLREVDENFRILTKKEPKRFVIIDANLDLEEVEEETLNVITKFLSDKKYSRKPIR